MNDKILKLATSLFNNKDCYGVRFSLVLNYKIVIEDRKFIYDEKLKKEKKYYKIIDTKYSNLNEDGLKRIEEFLSKEKVTSFNLTTEIRQGTDEGEGDDYAENWYSCRFIFHGEDKLEVVFDMLSDRYGLNRTEFKQFFGGKTVLIDENKIPETIQNLVDLRDLLIKNGDILAKQLNKFK